MHFVGPIILAWYFVAWLTMLRGNLHGNDAVCASRDLLCVRATKRILGIQATRVAALERLHGLVAWLSLEDIHMRSCE